jgi:hypothetical protein
MDFENFAETPGTDLGIAHVLLDVDRSSPSGSARPARPLPGPPPRTQPSQMIGPSKKYGYGTWEGHSRKFTFEH